jgi:hypothetical protein
MGLPSYASCRVRLVWLAGQAVPRRDGVLTLAAQPTANKSTEHTAAQLTEGTGAARIAMDFSEVGRRRRKRQRLAKHGVAPTRTPQHTPLSDVGHGSTWTAKSADGTRAGAASRLLAMTVDGILVIGRFRHLATRGMGGTPKYDRREHGGDQTHGATNQIQPSVPGMNAQP